jgi:cobalamin biosynthesis Mg chelatase CobN
MVRRDTAIARVGAPYLQPGPDRSPLLENLRLLTDRALPSIVSQANALRYGRTERRYSPVPFFLLVVLLVLAIVVLLLAVYFVVRRWL